MTTNDSQHPDVPARLPKAVEEGAQVLLRTADAFAARSRADARLAAAYTELTGNNVVGGLTKEQMRFMLDQAYEAMRARSWQKYEPTGETPPILMSVDETTFYLLLLDGTNVDAAAAARLQTVVDDYVITVRGGGKTNMMDVILHDTRAVEETFDDDGSDDELDQTIGRRLGASAGAAVLLTSVSAAIVLADVCLSPAADSFGFSPIGKAITELLAAFCVVVPTALFAVPAVASAAYRRCLQYLQR